MDEGYVRSAARLMQLTLSEEQVRGVTEQQQRIAVIAEGLQDAELDPCNDEMAPVWRP